MIQAPQSSSGSKNRYKGFIARFNSMKGYGFIETLDPQAAYFVHASELPDSLQGSIEPGTKVSFSLKPDKKKPDKKEACKVEIFGKPPRRQFNNRGRERDYGYEPAPVTLKDTFF